MTPARPLLVVRLNSPSAESKEDALRFSRAAESVSKKFDSVRIAVVPPILMVGLVAELVKIPVFAPGITSIRLPSRTRPRDVTPWVLRACGARGVLLNQGEFGSNLQDRVWHKAIDDVNSQGMTSIACVGAWTSIEKLASSAPTYIAVEPLEPFNPRSELIKKALRHVGAQTGLMVGQGIKTPADVKDVVARGAKGGVMVSSLDMWGGDPEAKIAAFAKALAKAAR